RQANIRVEPNLVVEGSEEQPQQTFVNPEEEDDEEGFFEGFEVDEEKLKQVKETLFRLNQVQTQLITVVREGLSQEDPDIVVTEEEEEINSFLLWDTSDLLDEAERRWELTQARILSSYIVERESLPNNFNLLDPNRYSTPLLRPEGVEKDGVLENEQENIRITYQNSGSFEGFEPEEPPMIHEVERQIEVLVAGHSWARDMEDGFSQNLLPNVEVEFRSYPGITLSGLKDKMITILDATYTHLVVFVLISEAYKRQPLTNSSRDRGYWITVANLDYDNTQFCGQFNEFVRHCREINPRLRILLIIPPFLDLAFYNSRRVSNFPQELQNLYNRQPEYATQLLHQQSVRMYNHLKTLRHDGYQWMGKETFPVMYAVTTLYGQRSRVRDFLEGRVWTLRQSGFLRDGLHPVALLCAKLWSRMNRARLFQLSVPGQLIVVNPVPDVPVGAPPSQIGQEQPSELDLSQPGPSGQGLSEVVELVVEEEVEVLNGVIEREEDLNVVEREERMEVNREEEAVFERVEMPVQAVADLSLEENTRGNPLVRNYSPIRFEREPSPEVGGGPVRLREERISRSRGSASSRRERRTPYVRPRSTSGVDSGEGVQSGVASAGADEILRQWELKLGELVAHMQGFLAAHGQETTPREIKNTIRRLWFQLTSQRNQHRSSCNFSEDFTTIFDLENTRYCALPSREESYRLIPFVEESSVPIEDKMSNPKYMSEPRLSMDLDTFLDNAEKQQEPANLLELNVPITDVGENMIPADSVRSIVENLNAQMSTLQQQLEKARQIAEESSRNVNLRTEVKRDDEATTTASYVEREIKTTLEQPSFTLPFESGNGNGREDELLDIRDTSRFTHASVNTTTCQPLYTQTPTTTTVFKTTPPPTINFPPLSTQQTTNPLTQNNDGTSRQTNILDKLVSELERLQNIQNRVSSEQRRDNSVEIGIVENENVPTVTNNDSSIDLSNISPISLVFSVCSFSPSFSHSHIFSRTKDSLCTISYSPEFQQTLCSIIEPNVNLEESINQDILIDYPVYNSKTPEVTEFSFSGFEVTQDNSFEFSGFKEPTLQWTSLHNSRDSLIDQVFGDGSRAEALELEWDDSALINVSPLSESTYQERIIQDKQDSSCEPTDDCTVTDLTQSPNTLLQFLADNYQLTDISSIPDLDELTPTYSIEGEVLLKRRISQTYNLETGKITQTITPRVINMAENNRSTRKIHMLVVGSSEAGIFRTGHAFLRDEYNIAVYVVNHSGCTLEQSLGLLKRAMKPHFDIVLVWALTPLAWIRTPIRTRGRREMTVFRPNPFFSINAIPGIMAQITTHAFSRNNQCRVYLVIPAVKDMYTFNQTRLIREWGPTYKDFLNDDDRLNPIVMNKHSCHVYEQFKSLGQDQFHWPGKLLMYGNFALNSYYGKYSRKYKYTKQKTPHAAYLCGESLSLNLGLIPDGLHGNQTFLKYFMIAHRWVLDPFREVERPLPPGGKRTRHISEQHQRMLEYSLHSNHLHTDVERNEARTEDESDSVGDEEEPQSQRRRIEEEPHNPTHDRVGEILYRFVDLEQPSTSHEGRSFRDRNHSPTEYRGVCEAQWVVSPESSSMQMRVVGMQDYSSLPPPLLPNHDHVNSSNPVSLTNPPNLPSFHINLNNSRVVSLQAKVYDILAEFDLLRRRNRQEKLEILDELSQAIEIIKAILRNQQWV
ncbi:hypothetical protein Anas_12895, partial [Armadillidium nasatum]